MDVHFVNPGGICHLPIAFWHPYLMLNILGGCLICSSIVDSIRQVIYKRYLTCVPIDRGRIECVGSMISSLVPIEEGPEWQFHFSSRGNTLKYLNCVAPGNRYGPGPIDIVANGLLRKPR